MASIEFPLSFKRQFSGPLDESSVYATLAELNDYITNDPSAYDGQLLSVSSGYGEGVYINLNGSASKISTTDWQVYEGYQGDVELKAGGKYFYVEDIPSVTFDLNEPFVDVTIYNIGYTDLTLTAYDELGSPDTITIPVGDYVKFDLLGPSPAPVRYTFIEQERRTCPLADKYTKAEVDTLINNTVTNIDWKEAVTTFSDLSSTYPSPDEGWTASVNDEDIVYRYDGTSWVILANGVVPLASETLDGKLSKEDFTTIQRLDDTVSVYGAGTSKVNGIYIPNGVNGYTLYDIEGNELYSLWYFSGGQSWIISDSINDLGTAYYSATTLVNTTPPESGWIIANAGTSPVPIVNLETVSQHTHRAEEIYGIDFGYIDRLDDTVSVYGAGEKDANGIYVRSGLTANGKYAYTLYDVDGTTPLWEITCVDSVLSVTWFIVSVNDPVSYQLVIGNNEAEYESLTPPESGGWIPAGANGGAAAPVPTVNLETVSRHAHDIEEISGGGPLSSSSWTELVGGSKLQWGSFTPTSSRQDIDLPIPFTSECYNVTVSIAEDISTDTFKNNVYCGGFPLSGDSSKITIVTDTLAQQIGGDIDGEAADDWSGYSVSMNDAGDIVAIGAIYNNSVNGNNSGHVRVYQNVAGNWTQIGQDIDGEVLGDESGGSVSLNSAGDIVAIGAIWAEDGGGNQIGHVRIYQWDGSSWTQVGQDIDGEEIGSQSGGSVSLNSTGDIVAIGAEYNDGNGANSGHVRVHQNVAGTWTQIGQDIDGEAAFDQSGGSVSLNSTGDIVAIGARYNDDAGNDSGHVRVYQNVAGTWTQIGDDIDGEAAGDESGGSVSLNSTGDIVAIGAKWAEDGSSNQVGHVRVYQNVAGTWTQIGQDIDGEATDDLSGRNVSLNSAGDIVAISAPLNDGNGANSGHVRVYQNVAGTWTQIGDDIDGEAAGDQGIDVSINAAGDIVAIGAIFNDGAANDSGHTRVYNTGLNRSRKKINWQAIGD